MVDKDSDEWFRQSAESWFTFCSACRAALEYQGVGDAIPYDQLERGNDFDSSSSGVVVASFAAHSRSARLSDCLQ